MLILYLLLNRELQSRKQVEHALRQAYGDLELRVRERTDELAQVNGELRVYGEQLRHRTRS